MGEVYSQAPSFSLSPLALVQNRALPLATGTFRSSPVKGNILPISSYFPFISNIANPAISPAFTPVHPPLWKPLSTSPTPLPSGPLSSPYPPPTKTPPSPSPFPLPSLPHLHMYLPLYP